MEMQEVGNDMKLSGKFDMDRMLISVAVICMVFAGVVWFSHRYKDGFRLDAVSATLSSDAMPFLAVGSFLFWIWLARLFWSK
jgi:hypothetical protein